MNRPHLVCNAGGGKLRTKTVTLHAKLRAFLESATDCTGAQAVLIEEPTAITDPLRARLKPDRWTHAALGAVLEDLAACGPLRGAIKYAFLLRDPRDATLLPYEITDLTAAVSRATLVFHEGTESRLHLDLVFPVDHLNDEVVRIAEAAERLAGVKLPPRTWLQLTPDLNGGRPARRRVAHFPGSWVERDQPEDAAVMAQILAAPDDDAPRQIYADLLISRDDPRGTFINVQCELARLALDSPRRPELEAVERKLLRAHGERWARLPRKLRGTFRRGFVEALSNFDSYLIGRTAPALHEVAPLLRSIVIPGPMDLIALQTFATAAGVLELTELAIETAELASYVLAKSPLARTLRRLRLVSTATNEPQLMLDTFEEPGGWPVLDSLEVGGPGFTAEACAALTRTPVGQRLIRFEVVDSSRTSERRRGLGR